MSLERERGQMIREHSLLNGGERIAEGNGVRRKSLNGPPFAPLFHVLNEL